MTEIMTDSVMLATESRPLVAKETKPGTFRIQIIDAGQGSSGFYPVETLQRAAKERVFKAGTHMHLDHPTATEMSERPVRSVKDWVGVLEEDAEFNVQTSALEAKVKVFAPYRELLTGMAPHVGVSIRAYAEGDYTKDGVTFSRITEALGVDYVTQAGRGGKILEVLESARSNPVIEANATDRMDQLERALRKEVGEEDRWSTYLVDFSEADLTAYYRRDAKTWKRSFVISDDDNSVTFTGEPSEVRQVVTFIPVSDEEPLIESKELHMTDTEKPDLSALAAAESRIAELLATVEGLNQRITDLGASLEESSTALAAANQVIAEAASAKIDAANKAKASAAIAEALAPLTIPGAAKDRIAAGLAIPVGEDGALDEARFTSALQEAIKVETDYIAAISPTQNVTGFGETRPVVESTQSFTNPWGRKTNLMEV